MQTTPASYYRILTRLPKGFPSESSCFINSANFTTSPSSSSQAISLRPLLHVRMNHLEIAEADKNAEELHHPFQALLVDDAVPGEVFSKKPAASVFSFTIFMNNSSICSVT